MLKINEANNTCHFGRKKEENNAIITLAKFLYNHSCLNDKY